MYNYLIGFHVLAMQTKTFCYYRAGMWLSGRTSMSKVLDSILGILALQTNKQTSPIQALFSFTDGMYNQKI
jgi:hypothetical protein